MTTMLAALPWPAAVLILAAFMIAGWLATGVLLATAWEFALYLALGAGDTAPGARPLRGVAALTGPRYPELHESKERVS